MDTFTRDALPGEVYTAWHPEALRANAILISPLPTITPYTLNPDFRSATELPHNSTTSTLDAFKAGQVAEVQ